jgi:hypothetical protein
VNAVEIEQAITDLAARAFDREDFPYAFLEAFGNKETTIKRLRSGATNKSDLAGVLQSNHIHIVTCDIGRVSRTLQAIKESPATAGAKATFALATDGVDFEAENMTSGETVACAFKDFPDHFGFFLPLAGICTIKQITDNAFDIRATSRLNRLYVELLKDNAEWGTADRRHDMNHFMARLIFCFFAEDTGIFSEKARFTQTVAQMSATNSSNTHEVIGTLFHAMNTKRESRAATKTPRWADDYPYVNGGLFGGSTEVPRFSKIARAYLLHVGSLDWTKINPDIFGSMIQAIADDEERGELGMHYTSVPNILKVLNPLFLDDLRSHLKEAGDNARALLNLRKRISRIRIFDPACGSGNFLVIAYKALREIEATINKRRGEPVRRSEIPLTNFRGIELRDFSAELARLALVIAEYQCDLLYRGPTLALAEFLPLSKENWITCGNALRLDWLRICPQAGTAVKLQADDLFGSPLEQAEISFDNEGGETYICGNPPYLGSRDQKDEHKNDLKLICDRRIKNWKSLDYVAGWFVKAVDYCRATQSVAGLVSTNSICQGLQVPVLWPTLFARGCVIDFAHTSFRWANLASKNAGVTVVIVGLAVRPRGPRRLFSLDEKGETTERQCTNINAYLAAGKSVIVDNANKPLSTVSEMTFGNTPIDGGHLLLSRSERDALQLTQSQQRQFVRRIYGSKECIHGLERYCLWIEDRHLAAAEAIPAIAERIRRVGTVRLKGGKTARDIANRPHQFQRMYCGTDTTLVVPSVSSETREYLPVMLIDRNAVVSNLAFALYDAPLWNMALIASRLHLAWVASVCGKLETRYRYSNTLGWNTFPVPLLTEKNKADLSSCAECILLARERHFPATIAELYDPKAMPSDLRSVHDKNDEVVERIYIGRRFRNDTERIEKLFELYTTMSAVMPVAARGRGGRKGGK